MLVHKLGTEVAATEKGIWLSELCIVRDTAVKRCWLGSALEEPVLDKGTGSLRDIVSAVDNVETIAKV